MDNFLQLVPMEADADSDSALVYGEEDDLIVHDNEPSEVLEDSMVATTAAQFFDRLPHFTRSSQGSTYNASPSTDDETTDLPHDGDHHVFTLAHERAQYLTKLMAMETAARMTQSDVDRRLEAIRRIRALRDPAEQLTEYLPLLIEQSRVLQQHHRRSAHDSEDDDSGSEDDTHHESIHGDSTTSAAELLQCAQQMSDSRDAEVALLAAFVFTCDAPHRANKRRRTNSTIPAIAALLDESLREEELDHHPSHHDHHHHHHHQHPHQHHNEHHEHHHVQQHHLI